MTRSSGEVPQKRLSSGQQPLAFSDLGLPRFRPNGDEVRVRTSCLIPALLCIYCVTFCEIPSTRSLSFFPVLSHKPWTLLQQP